MKKLRFLFIAIACFFTGAGVSFSQGDRCESIQPFCAGSTEFIFQNSSRVNGNISGAENGPDYGCLDSQPYPSWFYLQIDEPGNLNFQISQTINADGSGPLLDVDFIAWGPFKEDDSLCGLNTFTANNTISCGFSLSAVETFSINNAVRGEIYVVLITNFSEAAGYISLQQTNAEIPSAGLTDCSIVSILGDDQRVCETEMVELIAENVIADRYQWYILDDVLNRFLPIPEESGKILRVTDTGLYKVVTTNLQTGTALEDEVLIEFFDKPVATAPNDLLICNSGNTAYFNLNSTRGELLQMYPNSMEDFSTDFFASMNDYENEVSITSPDDYQGRDEQEIFATITDRTTGCSALPVNFKLHLETPIPISFAESTVVCLDSDGGFTRTIKIGEDLGPNYSYQWTPVNDPDGDGNQNPEYFIEHIPLEKIISVRITNRETGCSYEFSTEIKLIAPPQEVLVDIQGNDFEAGYSVTGQAISGVGAETTYEYRLDNGTWQTDPNFDKIPPGNHTISAREINGCGSVTSLPFRLIGYPKFFTPNSDGFNDTWHVVNDTSNSISKVLIFNRYGKVLKQLDPSSAGWDGTINGKAMKADDYWFLVEYKDSGTVKEYRGNFSLIR